MKNTNIKGFSSILDTHHEEIKNLRKIHVSVRAVSLIINSKLSTPIAYSTFVNYCKKYKLEFK